jgi:hypothetical protein
MAAPTTRRRSRSECLRRLSASSHVAQERDEVLAGVDADVVAAVLEREVRACGIRSRSRLHDRRRNDGLRLQSTIVVGISMPASRSSGTWSPDPELKSAKIPPALSSSVARRSGGALSNAEPPEG